MNPEKKKEGKANFNAIMRKYFRKEDVFLLPNVLCYFRVLLIIAFLIVYLWPLTIFNNDKANVYIASFIMVMAVYTDFLDGFIARKFEKTSNLGELLDPIADKLTQFAIAVAISVRLSAFASVFVLLGFFVLKELWMMLAVILLARHNRSYGGAKWYGKVATFMTYLVLGALLVAGPFILEAYPVGSGSCEAHLIIDTLCAGAIFFLLIAEINYTVLFFRLMHGAGNAEVSKPNEEVSKHD